MSNLTDAELLEINRVAGAQACARPGSNCALDDETVAYLSALSPVRALALVAELKELRREAVELRTRISYYESEQPEATNRGA